MPTVNTSALWALESNKWASPHSFDGGADFRPSSSPTIGSDAFKVGMPVDPFNKKVRPARTVTSRTPLRFTIA